MTQAALYLRISLDQTGEHQAIARQREDGVALARARGWEIVATYEDNSISASDRRKDRPGYDAMCRDFAAGRFTALICYDLDRLTRQPRQLEDWIDAAEERGLQLVTTNGEADLGTDAGRLFARIKAAVGRAEVERKAARQARAARQRAEQGRPAKGIRPTGYTITGEIVPEEAKVIRRIFTEFLRGDTLKGIAAALTRDGVPTRRGGKWSSSSVSSVLRNARYAGRSIYRGQDVGPGQWPAIITEGEFAAVAGRLAAPERRTNKTDRARRHLGSGVYYCECGLHMRSSSGQGPGKNRYTCRDAHYYRTGAAIDEYVEAVVRARLAAPDLKTLLVKPADRTESDRLDAQMKELRLRAARFDSDYDAGTIDGYRYRSATDRVRQEMDGVARAQARLAAQDEGGILTAPDPVAAYNAAPLAVRQRIIGWLARVTVLRAQQGRRGFDPDSVRIEWND
ncbi:recombinase family protein [Acidipropionibacterium jensenii]|uniref:Recombinase family protein n=1 Tax=Acidipropionibacterium jensenii TaxID=1749 RepID=A0A3T0S0T2_9ACTN|nr:recombinase family protein [Acidipropionibacterium jensenii]AZZ39942.1 recombinase family protein [Acidipropionibacterium jensenii]